MSRSSLDNRHVVYEKYEHQMMTFLAKTAESGEKHKLPETNIYELTNKPLEHTPPVISEDSLHNHLGICETKVCW